MRNWSLWGAVALRAWDWLNRPPTGAQASETRSKQEIAYDVMIRQLDSVRDALRHQADRANQWASISTLIVTFLSTILAVERQDVDIPVGIALACGFILFVSGLVILYQAQSITVHLFTQPKWDQLDKSITEPIATGNGMYYGIAEALGKTIVPEADALLDENAKTLNRGVFLTGLGVLAILATVLFILVFLNRGGNGVQPLPSGTPIAPRP